MQRRPLGGPHHTGGQHGWSRHRAADADNGHRSAQPHIGVTPGAGNTRRAGEIGGHVGTKVVFEATTLVGPAGVAVVVARYHTDAVGGQRDVLLQVTFYHGKFAGQGQVAHVAGDHHVVDVVISQGMCQATCGAELVNGAAF